MPIKISVAEAVAIGDFVYVGGIVSINNEYTVLKYNTAEDEWTYLPDHCVRYFGLCQFQGELLAIGGDYGEEEPVTNKVYCYSVANKKWVESLKPMPTKRTGTQLLNTASAIIACGGLAKGENGKLVALVTVEVYSSTTSQWHTADPLPQLCFSLQSVTISGCGFLLGGCDAEENSSKSVFCVDMATLINRATCPIKYVTTSPWKTLPDTPLTESAAATLSGGLLAVGGDDDDEHTQSTVHLLQPSTNSWVKLPSGDLPAERYSATAAQLCNNRVMVMGGADKENEDTSTCYICSVTV